MNIECYVLLTPSFGRVCNRRFSFRRATYMYSHMYCLFCSRKSNCTMAFFIWNQGINNKATTGENPLPLFSWKQRRDVSTRHRVVEHAMLSPWFATLLRYCLKTSNHRVNERWFFEKYHVCKRNLVDPSCTMKVPSSSSRFRSVTTLNRFWSG